MKTPTIHPARITILILAVVDIQEMIGKLEKEQEKHDKEVYTPDRVKYLKKV